MSIPMHLFTKISVGVLVGGVLGFIVAGQFSMGTLRQTGEIDFSDRQEVHEVYYPIPYVNPPNLVIDGTFQYRDLMNNPTGFRFSVGSYYDGIKGTWTALGVADARYDPRPFLQRLPLFQQIFGLLGAVGSVCSISGFARDFRSRSDA